TNDIALLKLSTPFDLTRPNISAVNLPATNNSTLPNVNESGEMVGFGIYLHPDRIPTTAQLATFRVDTHQRCAQVHAAYNPFNPIYNFCVDDDVTRRLMKLSAVYHILLGQCCFWRLTFPPPMYTLLFGSILSMVCWFDIEKYIFLVVVMNNEISRAICLVFMN
ncbi:hypothetical protein T265_15210, partial [Opisthorchis viverrini]